VLSFFTNRKPKQFKYKPRYQSKSNSKDTSKRISFQEKPYSDAMYERFDRIPFTRLKKAGRQRILIKAAVLAILLIILIVYIDSIEEMLKKLE
jgi:hypothetical protein